MSFRVKIIIEPSPPRSGARSFYLVNDYDDADAAETAAISLIAKREYDPQRVRWELVDTLGAPNSGSQDPTS